MNLVLDIGSTTSKAALFHNNVLVESFKDLSMENMLSLANKPEVDKRIISALGVRHDELQDKFPPFIYLDQSLKFPFINKYKTPETVGADRLALAAAAVSKYPDQNVLVVDAGTCITYELITMHREYLGGGISPGFSMRLKAMHEFTKTLPLLHDYYSEQVELLGNDTNSCLLSGTVHGGIKEVQGVIEAYQKDYPELQTIICGGDVNMFESILKESIFVDPNFLLFGLNTILEHNVKEN